MDLNNRNEVKCVGFRDWLGREKIVGTIVHRRGQTFAKPFGTEKSELGPFSCWETAAKALCPVVCGKCLERRHSDNSE